MTVYSPQYRINLLSLFNEAYAGNPASDIIRPLISQEKFKVDFGKRVILKIQERTLSGIDKEGRPFKGYSKEYIQSLVYKIYQKTSQVNMKLTGEMMASMTVTGTDYKTFVTIEFLDDHNKNKAHGHITGRLGKSVVRDFFGLPKAIEMEILKATVRVFQNETLMNLVDNVALDDLKIAVGARKLVVGQNALAVGIQAADEDILQ